MNALLYLLQLPWVEPAGWALIQFLWQGAAISAALWIGLRLAHRQSPQFRYLLACGAMLSCPVTVLLTFSALAKPASRATPAPRAARAILSTPVAEIKVRAMNAAQPTETRTVTAQATSPRSAPVKSVFARPLPRAVMHTAAEEAARWAVPIWMSGMLFLALRLAAAWCRVQLWRFNTAPIPDASIREAFARLRERLGIRRNIRLLLSPAAPAPLTIGWLRPLILLPAQALTGLSLQEIEAILAHELAHIRRYDYLVNLLQSALEVALFYHPAVWWMSRQIREVREECCDESAVRAGAGRLSLARALQSLAERTAAPQPSMAITHSPLVARVGRLLGRPRLDPILTGQNAAWTVTLMGTILVALAILNSSHLKAESGREVANSKVAPSGRVLDEHGAPVAQGRVLLYYAASHWGLGNKAEEEVSTDATGRFAFTKRLTFQVPNGSERTDHYLVFATKDGQAPAWIKILGSGPNLGEFTLQLSHPVSQTYEVVDGEGKPLAGATVWLRSARRQAFQQAALRTSFELPADCGVSRAITGADGKATLYDLPDGERSVAASMPGFEDCLSCTTPREGTPRFTLRPAAALEGRITDPLGRPVEDAKVWLYPKFDWHQYFLARTNKDGFYRIEKIWSNGTERNWGRYEIGIEHPSFTAETREVSFKPGETIRGFDIAAIAGTEIVGTLLDPESKEAVAGARMIVDSKSGRQSTATDTRGEFRCRVAPGEVRAFFSEPPGGHYVLGRGDVTQVRAFGAEIRIALEAPSRLGNLGTIRGKTVNADGQPVGRAKLGVAIPGPMIERAGWSGSSWTNATGDAGGNFEMADIPLGLPLVVIAETGDGKLSGLRKFQANADGVSMGEPMVLEPTTAAGVEVLVTGIDGQPRPNLSVNVAPVVEGVTLRESSLKTDATGVLRVPHVILALSYRIVDASTQSQSATIELAPKAGGAERRTVQISPEYAVRLEGADGHVLPIKSFKEYYVWIADNGERIRWSNGPLKILGRRADEVLVPRSTLVVGKPGDKIDFLIETDSGALINAEGAIPEGGSGVIVARAKEPAAPPDLLPDATISNVAPDEMAGRVVDPAGKPLSDVTVRFEGGADPKAPVFTTGADGIFRVPDARTRWFVYATVSHPGFAPVYLTDLPAGRGSKIMLQNSTRLAGTLGDGKAGEISLLLEKDKPTAREQMGHQICNIQFRAKTNADGSYDLPVEPGRYRFTAISADGRYARGETEVARGKVTPLPATLRRGVDTEFQVVDWQTGKPVEGFEVSIFDRLDSYVVGPREGATRTSDAQGMVRWENLRPGETQFESPRMAWSFPDQEQHCYVRWWREDEPVKGRRVDPTKLGPWGRDGMDAIIVDIGAGPNPIKIKVLMEAGVKISGTVTGPDGVGLPGVQVGTVPDRGPGATLTGDGRFIFPTDAHGQFHGYIPAGHGISYNLSAFYGPREKPSAFANAVSEPFSAKPGESLTFRLPMSKGGWITGKVRDASGHPAAKIKVSAMATDNMDDAYGNPIATTDAEGNFKVGPLRAGEYEVYCGAGNGVPIPQIPGLERKKATVADESEKSVGEFVLPAEVASN